MEALAAQMNALQTQLQQAVDEIIKLKAEAAEFQKQAADQQTIMLSQTTAVAAQNETLSAYKTAMLRLEKMVDEAKAHISSTGATKDHVLVDTRGIGKPSMYDSVDKRKFHGWRHKFVNFVKFVVLIFPGSYICPSLLLFVNFVILIVYGSYIRQSRRFLSILSFLSFLDHIFVILNF